MLPPNGFKDFNDALQGIGKERLTEYLNRFNDAHEARLQVNRERYPLVYEAGRAARSGEMPNAKEWFSTVSLCQEIRQYYGEGWHQTPEGRTITDELHRLAEEWQRGQ
jgi:hypothetical protein